MPRALVRVRFTLLFPVFSSIFVVGVRRRVADEEGSSAFLTFDGRRNTVSQIDIIGLAGEIRKGIKILLQAFGGHFTSVHESLLQTFFNERWNTFLIAHVFTFRQEAYVV